MDFYDLLDNLNQEQKNAVLDKSQACVVKAHVGSGKTTILIAKVLYYYLVGKISYENMVVLTFTNKAANEIKERLILQDSKLTTKELHSFGTFHSVALYLLRTKLDVESIGYSKDFSVMDPDEEVFMAESLIEEYCLDIKYPNKLSRRLELASKGNYSFGKKRICDDMPKLYELIAEEKRKQGKMNFDDLILNATMLLEKSDFSAKVIIIDEFQDTNPAQLDFLRAMIGENTYFFAVGDPNQIIYTWRGSNKESLQSFIKEFNATELTLSANYRSCGNILEVAKCILKNTSDLKGVKETGEQIIIQIHYNPFNEGYYIAEKISELREKGIKYQDIAIFYRMQKQSDVLEDALLKKQIPYEVSIKKTIKDISVLNWIVKLLSAATNNKDSDNIVAVLSNKHYGEHYSKKDAKKVLKEQNSDILPRNEQNNIEFKPSFLLDRIIGFHDWCDNHTKMEEVFDYFNLDSYINPTAISFEEDKNYIMAFFTRINDYISETHENLFTGIQSFINSSALYGLDILMKDESKNQDSVKLMTLHTAKGLEFEYVFIIGVNDGLIPLLVYSPEEAEEEKRLFFVGITRAKNHLELSYYTAPDEQRVVAGESRYISMIPSHLVMKKKQQVTECDLQSYRHAINNASKQSESQQSLHHIEKEQQVEHPRYGIGKVINDTGDIITVDFELYGEKEFMKVFNEVVYK